MSELARSTITVAGSDFIVEPGTFVEGTVRRMSQTQDILGGGLKSRPDIVEFLQDSWMQGSLFEKPKINTQNIAAYFDASHVDAVSVPGSVMPGRKVLTDAGLSINDAQSIIFEAEHVGDGAGMVTLGASYWYLAGWDGAFNVWTEVDPILVGTVPASADLIAVTATRANAGTPTADEIIYAWFDNGVVVEFYTTNEGGSWAYNSFTPTLATAETLTFDVTTGLQGSAIWSDYDYLYIYNGDRIARFQTDDFTSSGDNNNVLINDGDGPDVFQPVQTGTPLIHKNHQVRAIDTSEGIFYMKNTVKQGKVVCKAYRVDRDASGEYINYPLGTLPDGVTGINMTYHLSSVLISGVTNYRRAMLNQEYTPVTLYHITDSSTGAVGTPLGPEIQDDLPIHWCGADGETVFLGGTIRIYEYDPRLGAIHPIYKWTDADVVGDGGGFYRMVTVEAAGASAGTGYLFQSSGGANNAQPWQLLLCDGEWANGPQVDDSYLESLYFDFGVPMEEKTVYELFYDIDDFRTGESIVVKVSADGGAYSTVKTITEGVDDDTDRIEISGPAGYKFQYRIEFSDDDAQSTDPVTKLRAIGFAAFAGEMENILQFTINGWESINLENEVQSPKDVYDFFDALRETSTAITVTHTYGSLDADDVDTNTYRIANVTVRKDSPAESLIDVTLVET